jgi:phosphotriesterase-related protein
MWIGPVPGADPASPVLDQFNSIRKELEEYRAAGGHTILDCQPEGCGRDGSKLLALSKASGVNLVACTGFHRRKYYGPLHWLWKAEPLEICDFLCSEIETGLQETRAAPEPIRAGFIKIALEAVWEDCPQPALEGAAAAAARTKALVEIHTEKGALAERICLYFTDKGLSPSQLMLCHMDKRPDAGLHKSLAAMGVALEYDTFYRPKYKPAANLWRLLEEMAEAGFASHIALATDMAEAELYHFIGGGPGLASLPGDIRRGLREKGFPEAARSQLLGGTICRRLAGLN